MASEKREKPYPTFPLRWHPQGYWCKKIRGRVFYFGSRWGTWEEALEQYDREAADLHAGRTPKPLGITVAELADMWIENRERQKDAGELSDRSFRDYFREARRLVELAGGYAVESMSPTDFGELRQKIVHGVGVTAAANRIRIARMIFRATLASLQLVVSSQSPYSGLRRRSTIHPWTTRANDDTFPPTKTAAQCGRLKRPSLDRTDNPARDPYRPLRNCDHTHRMEPTTMTLSSCPSLGNQQTLRALFRLSQPQYRYAPQNR